MTPHRAAPPVPPRPRAPRLPLPLGERLSGRAVSDSEDAWIVLLDAVGARGWELVAVIDGDARREYLFKRPVAD